MFVQNKEQIFQRMTDNRKAIDSLGVCRFGLFGSFVTGKQTAESDVDILVEFRPGEKTFDSFMNLAFLLEDILGRKVDLVTKESLSPYIGPKILAEVDYGLVD
ncbi:nucleotidyltransferase family protein [soil metagenome]